MPLKLPLKAAVPMSELRYPLKKYPVPWVRIKFLRMDVILGFFSVELLSASRRVSNGYNSDDAVHPDRTALITFRKSPY